MKLVLLFLAGLWLTEARLVFPPGTDEGYIVPDDDETDFDTNFNGLPESAVKDEPKSRGSRRFLTARSIHRRDAVSVDEVEIEPIENWPGKWFPRKPNSTSGAGKSTTESLASSVSDSAAANGLGEDMKDEKHGIVMGVSNIKCDDAKTNLTLDWDESPINYTCYTPKNRILPRSDVKPIETADKIDPDYFPQHYCMNKEIHYSDVIPTFGDHRPLWPKFGEYKFVPRQRWLHNIEHGAVVMLYHPCADYAMVDKLRKLVTQCIRKHIITPFNLVSEERPLVLVAWGNRLEMAKVDTKLVKNFIRNNAMKGPEGKYPKEGMYNHKLITLAKVPAGSDYEDSVLCPV